MAIFIVTSQHSPDNCPIHNEKARKVMQERSPKLEEAIKKHGVKMIGGYVVMPEHKVYFIYDAPTSDDFGKAMAEQVVIQWMGENMTEIKRAWTLDEADKMFIPH
jgi:uncharacterized protein with GYD domain